jgi:hypothetical protein
VAIDDNKLFEAAVAAGQSALRVAMLVNGAAATALLALISSIYGKDEVLASKIASNLPLFGFGVASAAVATGIVYCAQELQSRKHYKRSEFSNWIAIALVVVSYVLFTFGVYRTSHEFSSPVNNVVAVRNA